MVLAKIANRHVFLQAASFQAGISGALFGWFNMSSMLATEGVFADLCAGGPVPCSAQAQRLGTLYTVAAALSFCGSPVSGYVIERFGPRVALRSFMALQALGYVLCLIAASVGAAAAPPALWWVGFLCIGFASASTLLPTYDVAALFPEASGLVISYISGCADVASIIYFIMLQLVRWLAAERMSSPPLAPRPHPLPPPTRSYSTPQGYRCLR